MLAGWTGLLVYVTYSEDRNPEVTSKADANYSTEAYSIDELKRLARLEEKVANLESQVKDSFLDEEIAINVEEAVLIPELEVLQKETQDINNPYLQELDYYRNLEGSSFGYDSQLIVVSEPNTEELLIPDDIVSSEKNIDDDTNDSLENNNDINEYVKPEPTYYSSEGFVNLYNSFEAQKRNLNFLRKYVYNIEPVDNYIINKAVERGYQRRGFAVEQDIVPFEDIRTRPEVRDAYINLRNEMEPSRWSYIFASGYRSSSHQRACLPRS